MNKAGLTTRHTTKCRTYTRIDVELGPLATSTPFLSLLIPIMALPRAA